jgi:anaerobic selenocysteine-containing dehydrogenase
MCAVAVECGAGDVADALGGPDADEICERSGAPRDVVEELSGALDEADSAAVLLSNPGGYCCHPRSVVRATAEMARAAGAALYPLYGCPNARSPVGTDTMPGVLEAMRSGEVRAAVVVGFDPMGRFAPAVWGEAANELEFVVYAGSLRTRFTVEADAVLPVALPWEESGSYEALGEGIIPSASWAPLPDGVADMTGLLDGLAHHLDSEVAPSGEAELADPQAVSVERMVGDEVFRRPDVGDGRVTAVGEAEVYADGNSAALELSSWTRRMAGREKVIMAPDRAEELGVEEGDPVTLGEDSLTLPCGIRDGMPRDVIAVPSHREGIKRLLQWRVTEDVVEVGPAEVSIRSAE